MDSALFLSSFHERRMRETPRRGPGHAPPENFGFLGSLNAISCRVLRKSESNKSRNFATCLVIIKPKLELEFKALFFV